MVKRFHYQLKTSLIAHGFCNLWTSYLHYVLLGIRSTFKSDLKYTLAELVYGTTLRSPGDNCVSPYMISLPSNYIHGLRKFFNQLTPAPSQTAKMCMIFVSDDLGTCTHVFVHRDMVKSPHVPHYDGAFLVLSSKEKTFAIHLYGHLGVVSTDCLKIVYLPSSLYDCFLPSDCD